ncbi:hypothetical protein GCM10022235_00800 [Kribbella ginsengisoli]|uniref:Uncharacterized protein n=1 Tax=Kribbella ginsengisoli TaxID=363865 RepID=A0ABP6VKR5_9ACTN
MSYESDFLSAVHDRVAQSPTLLHALLFDRQEAIRLLSDLPGAAQRLAKPIDPSRVWLRLADVAFAAGCDASQTCSCTTGTCEGTCGGSTCGVTCSGESCGRTCDDSCGHTTNWAAAYMWRFGQQ